MVTITKVTVIFKMMTIVLIILLMLVITSVINTASLFPFAHYLLPITIVFVLAVIAMCTSITRIPMNTTKFGIATKMAITTIMKVFLVLFS